MQKGPISTPSMIDIGDISGKPTGSPMINGEPGLPGRSGYSSGVAEVTYEPTPGGMPKSGVIEPMLPPLFKGE